MRSSGPWGLSLRIGSWIGIALFWVAGIAVPILTLLARAQGSQALLDPAVIRIAEITAGQALLSAGIAALVALPMGVWVGSSRASGRRWAQALLALPFGVPSVVAGLAWIGILGRSGILARLGWTGLDWAYSFKAVILAHVIFNVPWIALWVAQSRAFLPESYLEAAKTLGAKRWAQFTSVIWPQVRWAFWSSVCQAFVFCAMSFALILILGGGPPVQTLEVALYTSMRFGDLDLSRAIACALWELLITVIPWCLVVYFQSRDERQSIRSFKNGESTEPHGGLGATLKECAPVAFSAFFFVPYFAVLTFGKPWSETRYSPLWQEILPALRVSAVLAVFTAIGALLVAVAGVVAVDQLPESRRGLRAWVAFLMGIPSGISALVLGLGIWLAYGKWIDPFSGSYLAIIALQIAIFFPTAFRVLWPVVRDRPVRQVEAALLLGASRERAFWIVEWPRWRAPILSALGMVAGASLGEVAAVSLFYSESLVPLPLLITRWAAQYRFQDAQSVAVL